MTYRRASLRRSDRSHCGGELLSRCMRREWSALNARALQIQLDERAFSTTVLTPGGVINIRETYDVTGEPRLHRRRDLRGGSASGRVEFLLAGPAGVTVRTLNEWGAPFRGGATETFSLVDGVLLVDTKLELEGQATPVQCRAIYRRADQS